MPRWLRVIRGMIGTGLTFATGVGVVSLIIGLIGVALGALSVHDLPFIARLTVVAFVVGVLFSGVLALTVRGRSFEKLSLAMITVMGSAGGFLFFVFLAMNGGRRWSGSDAIANLITLVLLGAGAAAATLIVARRARHSVGASDESLSLGEGSFGTAPVRELTEHKSKL